MSFQYNNKMYEPAKKIYYEKLFPKIHDNIPQNLMIDEESISYITTPCESQKIAHIINDRIKHHKPIDVCSVVDVTGGIGGDTITFASFFASVISIENDPLRYSYLKNNVEKYELNNVITVEGDSTLIVSKLEYFDVIYIDPPWGGKLYKSIDKLCLNFGNESLETFIENCFNDDIMLCIPIFIVIKLPKNYDMDLLNNALGNKYYIHIHKLIKINIIIVEKKLVY